MQGTSSSPSSFSPSSFSPSSTAMFQEATYGQTSRFTPSPPELAVGHLNENQHEGISPALRRGPLPFGAMPAPNDEVIQEMSNTDLMDEETSIWYEGHRNDILRPTPASSSSSPAPTSSSSPSTASTAAASTFTAAAATSAAASTTACEETGPSDTAVPGGTADAPVSV
nr:uncharacterized protein LOC127310112 [Lolium perenne]